MSTAEHLQKHLFDLRERERLSKLHNWELQQQFEDAQKTLRKMLDRTAAMKKLRKEYESYLWSSHQDNQVHLKAQTTQENMPGGHQITCQKNSETSYTLLSHGLGKMPRTTGAYHGETFPSELQPSWQTMAQKQTAVFPNQAEQRLDITQSSPLSFPHSHLVGSHHLPFTHSLQPYASRQTSPSTDHPGLSLSKQVSDCNTSDQHYTHHSNPQSQKERPPPSSIPSEQKITHNEDIDIKPVRLSSHSSRTSSQGSTQNKDKKNQRSSSDESHYSSHNLSPLRAVATGIKAVALKSESEKSETSSHRTSKQSSGLGFKDTRNTLGESLSDNEDNDDTEVCNSDKTSGSAQLPQTSISMRLKDIATPAETKASISDQSSLQDEDEDSEKEKTYEDRKETRQENDKENADIPRYSSEEEADKETDGSDDEESTGESASSECEGGEDNLEEPLSNKDNGQKVDKTKTLEDSDSEDCIVSPQIRSKVIYVIPEYPSEHEASSRKTASSDDDQESSGSSDDDIEQVLAPQENTQEDGKQPKPDDEANESCDIVARFCVKEERKEDHSNESDDFYD